MSAAPYRCAANQDGCQHVEIPMGFGGCIRIWKRSVCNESRNTPCGVVPGFVFNLRLWSAGRSPFCKCDAICWAPGAVKSHSPADHPSKDTLAVCCIVVIIWKEPAHHRVHMKCPPTSDGQLVDVGRGCLSHTAHVTSLAGWLLIEQCPVVSRLM